MAKSFSLSGHTPTGQALEELLNKYIPFLEDSRLGYPPITLIVITDGVPSSHLVIYHFVVTLLYFIHELSGRPERSHC